MRLFWPLASRVVALGFEDHVLGLVLKSAVIMCHWPTCKLFFDLQEFHHQNKNCFCRIAYAY